MDLCLSLCFISVESNRTLFNCLLNLLGENQNGNWYQGWTKVIRKEDKKTSSMNRFGRNLKLSRMICGTFLTMETMICRPCSIRIKKVHKVPVWARGKGVKLLFWFCPLKSGFFLYRRPLWKGKRGKGKFNQKIHF